MRILPSKQELIQVLGERDFFLWEYYGKGVLCKIQAWIFRSRIKVLMRYVTQLHLQPRLIVDVGSGPMFISYPLASNATGQYIGVDIMRADRLKKYKDALRNIGIQTIEAVRASAEALPFRNEIFDFALSLDLLEHLSNPRESVIEIYRVVRKGSVVAISLPLENLFQRLSRIGFILMKIVGDIFLEQTNIPITRTPEYHYARDIKSYEDMVNALKGLFSSLQTRYTPIGLHKSINVNAVHILRKK